MASKGLEAQWKCRCTAGERTLWLRWREQGENVAEFMEYVQKEVTKEHRRVSPLCVSPVLEYLKLPVDEGGGGIGMRIVN
jgi:hypothetical protein